jgi:hypothetical protein
MAVSVGEMAFFGGAFAGDLALTLVRVRFATAFAFLGFSGFIP